MRARWKFRTWNPEERILRMRKKGNRKSVPQDMCQGTLDQPKCNQAVARRRQPAAALPPASTVLSYYAQPHAFQ